MTHSAAGGSTNPWDYFDAIFCITLFEREDRQRQAREQFRKVGLADRVTFVTVDRHPEDSEQGIFESHRLCLRRGLDQGAGTMVIFEDDVIFERFSPGRLKRCTDFLDGPHPWRAFFFGCLVKSSRRTGYPGVLAVKYRSLAHAYAVRRSFAEIVVNKPWQGVPFDAMLADLNGNYFAAYPAFAFQGDCASDNRRKAGLERFRRWCGGLKRIQKANEWTRRHMVLLVAVHAAVIAALGGIIWRWWR
jgi:hypothetical protein